MKEYRRNEDSPSLLSSQRGMSLPVTFLMLFVSLIVLISATYYFSIIRINMKTQAFKVSGAEQEMLSLEKIISFVAWSPGASHFYEFGNFGGEFQVEPIARRLVLNLTDDSSFKVVFFNSSIGKIVYQLPSSETQNSFFLVGDNRAIVNQSWSTTTQLSVSQNIESHYEIALSYRPSVSSAVTGASDGKPINNLRVCIVNFNSSQSVTRLGSFRLKASCLSVASNWQSYNFSNPISSLLIKASLDGHGDEISLPIAGSPQGAIVNLETIICHVKMETLRW
ncbi:MAG: hypothetical protein NWE77_07500 [Candidatus Bathyarchaeota archaeon]|jgi:hypothetical protein|nr:hypothetical protein [Candidatus Bathyarchaeota archaeon]UCC27418.1 MAG: hypothetical protein JSW29_04870 [Candidatus Bathyarchaeota archaeon]